MDTSVQQALIDRSVEMKHASDRLRKSAEKVRVAQILNELVRLLDQKGNDQGSILLRSALLVARLATQTFILPIISSGLTGWLAALPKISPPLPRSVKSWIS